MMPMKLLPLACAAALAGCGTPAVVTQRVEVPVAVRPIAPADVPAPPVSEFAATAAADALDVQIRALLIDRETTAAYVARLRALVGACVGPAVPQRLPTVE